MSTETHSHGGVQHTHAHGHTAHAHDYRLPDLPEAVVTEFGAKAQAAASPVDDVRGTAAYRRHGLAVMARRTLTWAWNAFQDREG